MPRIDSHQHFWDYSPGEYPWIQPDWPIRRSFLPPDLAPLLQQAGLKSCVAVQARQTLEENRWLLGLAEQHDIIAGVVGWVDLCSPEVEEQLAEFAAHPKFVGVRHVVQEEPDDRFMLRDSFLNGISKLKAFDLAYDILIFPKQLPAAIELVRHFPEQRFVLDHLAKPPIREQIRGGTGGLEPWRTQFNELARSGNVMCKLSGMVTEARWGQWHEEQFQPFLETAWDAFGEDRLMIGSDWPVCLLSAEYDEAIGLVTEFLEQFPVPVREKVLGANASKFYLEPKH